MNCGVCTAICPAAEFYNYDPRTVVDSVQRNDEETIQSLIRSDLIWYCGECMSCRTRCPRGNTPGLIIMALRKLAQEEGTFVDSEKGRQQYALKRVIDTHILERGYCVTPDLVKPEMHPEQGPVWEWIYEHMDDVFERVHANYRKPAPEHCGKWIRKVWTNCTRFSMSPEVPSSSGRYRAVRKRKLRKAIRIWRNIFCRSIRKITEHIHKPTSGNRLLWIY